jgi:hypothetical protein
MRAMKKTFPLQSPTRDDARVRDKIRQEVNRDVRRQKRKPLPEGFKRWEFNCRVGPSPESAEVRALKEVGGAIDAIALTGATAVYVEVLPIAQL